MIDRYIKIIQKKIHTLIKRRYIYIQYTNGTGNNLFQYNFCYLLSKGTNVKIINQFFLNQSMYSIHNRLISRFLFLLIRKIGIKTNFISIINNKSKSIPRSFINLFSDTGEVLDFFQGKELIVKDNFFKKNSRFIFLKEKRRKYVKLVIHLRLGDRLIRKDDYEYGMFYDFKKLQLLIDDEISKSKNKINILIVTDTPNIMNINSIKDLHKLKSHTYVQKEYRVDFRKALDYIYSIQEFINRNQIIIKKSENLSQDFSEMLNADILIFLHGTLSWWAGYLGNQDKIYVSKLWRPSKVSNSLLSRYKSKKWIRW